MEKLVSSWSTNKTLPENYIFPPDKRPGDHVVPTSKTVPIIDLSDMRLDSTQNTIQKIVQAGKEFRFFQIRCAERRPVLYHIELSPCTASLGSKRSQRRGNSGKFKALEEVALIDSPCNVVTEVDAVQNGDETMKQVDPAAFPITVPVLSTIPVALHGVGGDDGPLYIAARLYVTSYFR